MEGVFKEVAMNQCNIITIVQIKMMKLIDVAQYKRLHRSMLRAQILRQLLPRKLLWNNIEIWMKKLKMFSI
jgi:hypothetical protein